MKRGVLYLALMGALIFPPANSLAQDKKPTLLAPRIVGKENILKKNFKSIYETSGKLEYDLKAEQSFFGVPLGGKNVGNITYKKNSLEYNLNTRDKKEHALFYKESDFLYIEEVDDRKFTYELRGDEWIFTKYEGNNQQEKDALNLPMHGLPLIDLIEKTLEKNVDYYSKFEFFTFADMYRGEIISQKNSKSDRKVTIPSDNFHILQNGKWNKVKNDKTFPFESIRAFLKGNKLRLGNLEIKGDGFPYISKKLKIELKTTF